MTVYNKLLDTFLVVAKSGSFTKASEHLYITHTAVKKQIDSLESQLGVKLFSRSNQGLALTNAGLCLQSRAPEIIKLSTKIIQDIQKVQDTEVKTIRVGTSSLYPSTASMELWDRISDHYPGFELSIVPIANDKERLDLLGKDYDILIGPYNASADMNGLNFIPVGEYRFCFSMKRKHLLSGRKILSFKDLSDETLMIMKKGNSAINDRIRAEIEKNYADITIQDIEPHYDYETFNQCAKSESILLSLECWEGVHPSLINVPMLEDHRLPFGIVAADNPSGNVSLFIKAIREVT